MAAIVPGQSSTGLVQTLTETVKNTSGGTLLKGTPVRITGATGQEANVGAADASTAFPANFVLAETLAAEESGQAVALGFINNVSVPNASLFTAGQEVYLAVGGGWTTTRPTGAANIQLLGNIVKVNTGANTISGIFAPQNIEYLPNLAQGKVWVGSAAGIPEESDPTFSGQIINGVAHFVSTTAPTFRRNAAGQNIGALAAGDEWYKPTDNGVAGTAGDWIWTGAYWVSQQTSNIMGGLSFTYNISATPFTSTQHNFMLPINANGTLTPNLYVVGCSFSYKVVAPVDATNYWWLAVFACRFQSTSGGAQGGEAVFRINGLGGDTDATLRTTVAGVKTDLYKSVEAPISFGVTPTDFFPTMQVYAYKQGSPGNLQGLAVNLIIRRLHP